MPPVIPGLVFEAVAEPAAGAGGGEAAPEATPAATPEATPAATPAPDYGAMLSSPEGQQALQQALNEAMQGYEPYYEPEQQYGQQPDDPFSTLDFLSEDAGTQLSAILQARDQALLEALSRSPAMTYAVEQQQTQWANGEFERIEGELGGQVPQHLREMAMAMAAGSHPPENDPAFRSFNPSAALRSATTSLRDLIANERAAAVREYQAAAAGGEAGGAGALEPSASGMAAIHSEERPTTMRDARLRIEQRWAQGG